MSSRKFQSSLPALAVVCLVAMGALGPPAFGAAAKKGPKVHIVGLGTATKVLTPAEAGAKPKTMVVRGLFVDGRRKEWTTGEAHDVTDHSFVVRQVTHINDALPSEKKSHFTWQAAEWLLVDRSLGHIKPIVLPLYDPKLTGVVWFRDYATYCGVSPTGKTLYGMVVELGVRKAIVRKRLGKWPEASGQPAAETSKPTTVDTAIPTASGVTTSPIAGPVGDSLPTQSCADAEWQRQPARVTFHPLVGDPVTVDVAEGAPIAKDGAKAEKDDEDAQ